MSMATAPVLKLCIQPDWAEVDLVRQESAAFLRSRGIDPDAIDALSMVACEMTENAVKYGRFGERARTIDVSVTHGPEAVTVEVRSPVGDPQNVTKLDHMIQWIRGHQDPFEAYLG